MTSKRFIHPGSRLMILVLSACLLCSCGAPWETAGNPKPAPESANTETLGELPEGNRGNVTIKSGGQILYTAALNDSGRSAGDTDRENCAAFYGFDGFVLIGDHNYQGFDILEDVDSQSVLVITPPGPDARNLALPPGAPEPEEPVQDSDSASQYIISPISGRVTDQDGNPADSADEPTDSTQDPADSARDPADGNSGIAAGEYHFLERRKGVRQYGTLFDEDGHWLDEMAVATGASYITYTCRGHSDTDVWIVFWK